MRTGMIAALAGAALMFGVGSALAEDGPLRPQDIAGPYYGTTYGGGSDLALPQAYGGAQRGNADAFRCLEARMEPVPNNPRVRIFCDPGAQ